MTTLPGGRRTWNTCWEGGVGVEVEVGDGEGLR